MQSFRHVQEKLESLRIQSLKKEQKTWCKESFTKLEFIKISIFLERLQDTFFVPLQKKHIEVFCQLKAIIKIF